VPERKPVFGQEFRNPKHEIRNKDQNPKRPNDRNIVFSARCFLILEIDYLNLFRISDFDIRLLPESHQDMIFVQALTI